MRAAGTLSSAGRRSGCRSRCTPGPSAITPRRASAEIRLIAAAVILLAAAGLLLWPVPALVVETGTGRVLWSARVRSAVELRLEYVHSVERTPVVEVYVADGRGLRMVRMEFASQGAGLPTEGYVLEGGRFVLRTDRPLQVLQVRVSGLTRPRLLVGGESLDLVDAVGDGGLASVQVRPRPRVMP